MQTGDKLRLAVANALRPIALVCLALAASACGSSGPTGMREGPILIEGGGQSDTIEARLPHLLSVSLAGVSSRVLVQFVPIAIDTPPPNYPTGLGFGAFEALPAPPGQDPLSGGGFADSLTPTHPAQASVFLGPRAGSARLVLVIDSLRITDTVSFTVHPGRSVGVIVTPRDTVIYLSGSVALQVSHADRFGNPASLDSGVTLHVVHGPVALAPDNRTLSAQQYGVAAVAASGPGTTLADSATVTIVPQGTLAVAVGGVAVVNLDGSGYRVLMTGRADNLRWDPSGTRIVFDQGDPPSRLQTVDTSGNVQQVDTSSVVNGSDEFLPAYSHDGKWIYFTLYSNTDQDRTIWRIAADGSSPPTTVGTGSIGGFWPTPSPDGTTLMITNGAQMYSVDLSSAAITALSVYGTSPAWSPQGNLIAYNNNQPTAGSIEVVQPDGSANRVVTGSLMYAAGEDWSPDGQWLVAYDFSKRWIDLINASSGLTLPLHFTTNMGAPTWRPITGALAARVRASAAQPPPVVHSKDRATRLAPAEPRRTKAQRAAR